MGAPGINSARIPTPGRIPFDSIGEEMTMARSSVIRRGVGLVGALWVMVASSAIAADEPAKREKPRDVTTGGAEIPDEWLEGTSSSRAQRFDGLKVGQAPPELAVAQWKNGEPIELSSL